MSRIIVVKRPMVVNGPCFTAYLQGILLCTYVLSSKTSLDHLLCGRYKVRHQHCRSECHIIASLESLLYTGRDKHNKMMSIFCGILKGLFDGRRYI